MMPIGAYGTVCRFWGSLDSEVLRQSSSFFTWKTSARLSLARLRPSGSSQKHVRLHGAYLFILPRFTNACSARRRRPHHEAYYHLQGIQYRSPSADGRGSNSFPCQFMFLRCRNVVIVAKNIPRRPRET